MAKEFRESDWLCIATEGRAVDGREMMREWLSSAAKNYNSDFFSAVIWNEHHNVVDRAYQLNLGLVLELKTEEEDGKLKLYAKLAANKFLLALNDDNQKLFCSVEITSDFPDVGQFYLTGLAVTDQPALPGISQLKFSQERGNTHTGLHEFSLSTEQQNTGSNTMTEEIQELKEQLAAQAAKIEELESALAEKNTEKAAEIADELTELASETSEQSETVAETVVSTEEFTALKNANIELTKKFDALEKKFSRAITFSTTPTPDLKPTVGADLNMFV